MSQLSRRCPFGFTGSVGFAFAPTGSAGTPFGPTRSVGDSFVSTRSVGVPLGPWVPPGLPFATRGWRKQGGLSDELLADIL